jgi:hypothetical protein
MLHAQSVFPILIWIISNQERITTPLSSFLLDKPSVANFSAIPQNFTESTGPYPEPDDFNTYLPILIL